MLQLQKMTVPSEDKRWRMVNATMRRHGYKHEALIETLHTVQEAFGFLSEESLRYVASNLRIPLSRVIGVATFYNHFHLKPKGEHSCVVCLGTACYIKGGPNILQRLQTALDIKAGETTQDNKVSLMIAHCVGMCWLAPVVEYDSKVEAEVTPEQAVSKVKELTHVS